MVECMEKRSRFRRHESETGAGRPASSKKSNRTVTDRKEKKENTKETGKGNNDKENRLTGLERQN